MAVDVNQLKARNAQRWADAKLNRDFSSIAKRLVAGKVRYKAVEAKTGVPWFVIAVIHMRESSQSWTRSLAQGDPINQVSTHVPRGRGPFATWEDAAIDALVNCGPFLARKKDWSLGGTLANLELYNGAGYANKDRPSPYLWAGTNQYVSGKYVADGVYDPNHVDTQPGCAGMILAMRDMDKDIQFGATPPVTHPDETTQLGTVWIQTKLNILNEKGVITLPAPLETKSGIYGPKTQEAVEIFQRRFNVTPIDGIAGPITIKALGAESAKIQKATPVGWMGDIGGNPFGPFDR